VSRRARNPLIPFHEQDREALLNLIQRVCGCSDQTANQILRTYPGGVGLDAATRADLRSLGLNATQAKRLHGAFELARRVAEADLRKGAQLNRPEAAVAFVRAHVPHTEQEMFVVLFLDARQKVIDARVVAVGSIANLPVHPREVFREAIRLRAHSVLVAHNHPSQDPMPSQADFELTERLVDVGKLLGIPVLDHIVLGRTDSVSLAALGQVPLAGSE
jgi:DNA repair protein RadC